MSAPLTKTSSTAAIEDALTDLLHEAELVELLAAYKDRIAELRARGLSDERIAERFAAALHIPVATILEFLKSAKSAPESTPKAKSTQGHGRPAFPPTLTQAAPPLHEADLPKIASGDIRDAVAMVMKKNRVKHLRLVDEHLVVQIVELIPALGLFPNKHMRNRRIMDACVNRKIGPTVTKNARGKREIVIKPNPDVSH